MIVSLVLSEGQFGGDELVVLKHHIVVILVLEVALEEFLLCGGVRG